MTAKLMKILALSNDPVLINKQEPPKYASIIIHGYNHLFGEVNCLPLVKLQDNCELPGTGVVQRQTYEQILKSNG